MPPGLITGCGPVGAVGYLIPAPHMPYLAVSGLGRAAVLSGGAIDLAEIRRTSPFKDDGIETAMPLRARKAS